MELFGVSYIALWIIVLTQVALLIFLLRQVGTIFLGTRDAIERDGIEPGKLFPIVEGRDADGRPTTASGPSDRWKVFIYSVPTCQICREILPALSELVGKLRSQVQFVVLLQASPELLDGYLNQTGRTTDAICIDRSVAKRLRLRVSPFVHVIDPDSVVRAKGLVNEAGQIEHLLVTGGLSHDALSRHVELKHGVAG